VDGGRETWTKMYAAIVWIGCTCEHLFRECPEWKPQQKILWAEVKKETGRWKDRRKVRDLLADGRCSRAVLDFLSAADVARRVLGVEDDAVSAVSELEVREWMEERGAGAEESDGEGPPLFLPTPDFMASAGEGRPFHLSFSFVLFPLYSPWCAPHLLGIGLGGGQRGASNVPPMCGQRTGTGLYIISP